MWDAVRIGGKKRKKSTLRYCVVESSHRGIEGIEALLSIGDSIFRDNGRGVGLRDSEATIMRSTLADNGEGVAAFNSTVEITLSRLEGNVTGILGDQSQVFVNYCVVEKHALAGVDLRYCNGAVVGTFLRYNTPAVVTFDSALEMDGLRVLRNNLYGFLFRRSEVYMKFSMMGRSAGNGLTAEDSAVTIRRTVFLSNLRYTLENDSEETLDAILNIWDSDERPIQDLIHDRQDDPSMGAIDIYPQRFQLNGYKAPENER